MFLYISRKRRMTTELQETSLTFPSQEGFTTVDASTLDPDTAASIPTNSSCPRKWTKTALSLKSSSRQRQPISQCSPRLLSMHAAPAVQHIRGRRHVGLRKTSRVTWLSRHKGSHPSIRGVNLRMSISLSYSALIRPKSSA